MPLSTPRSSMPPSTLDSKFMTPGAIATRLQNLLEDLEESARCSASEVAEDDCADLIAKLTAVQMTWSQARASHEALRAEIVTVDPALVSSMNELGERHAEIDSNLWELISATLAAVGSPAGPARLAQTQALRTQALESAAECRTHEGRLSTALMEAHFRDRGRGAS